MTVSFKGFKIERRHFGPRKTNACKKKLSCYPQKLYFKLSAASSRSTKKRPPIPMPYVVRRVGGIVVTLTFVSLMSAIANQPSNRALARYVLSFVGVHVA